MKTKELKQALANVPDDFDIEVMIGHADFEPESTSVAQHGKSFTIQLGGKESFASDMAYDFAQSLMNIRDNLEAMLKETYSGPYTKLKRFQSGSGGFLSDQRRTTLKEAGKRITFAVKNLNKQINGLVDGKEVKPIRHELEERADEAEEALRLICIAVRDFDPSDGEGTSPQEVVNMVNRDFKIHTSLLKRSRSVIDKLMGDSDLDSDESEEMKVCQEISKLEL